MSGLRAFVILSVSVVAAGCGAGSGSRPFVRPLPSTVALLHARIIDGAGVPAQEDQTLLLERGQIAAAGAASQVRIPEGIATLDLAGRTVMSNDIQPRLEPPRHKGYVDLSMGLYIRRKPTRCSPTRARIPSTERRCDGTAGDG